VAEASDEYGYRQVGRVGRVSLREPPRLTTTWPTTRPDRPDRSDRPKSLNRGNAGLGDADPNNDL